MSSTPASLRKAIGEAQSLVGDIAATDKKLRTVVQQRSAKQWRLADLTHTNTIDNGGDRQKQFTHVGKLLLNEWAEKVGGYQPRTFGEYRRVWTRYGDPATRLHYADGVEATFYDHVLVLRKAVSPTDITTRQSDEPSLSRQYIAGYAGEILTPQKVAEAVKADPSLLGEVAPAIIANRAAEPTVARAIARNDAAREAVEEEALEVRVTRRSEYEPDRDLPKKVGAAMNKALKIDEATTLLHEAAGRVAEAALAKDEYGINYPEAEAEAIKKLRRYVSIYVNDGEINGDDREWLAGIGVEL